MERTFKINQVMTINLHLTQFLPEMRIGEMSSKLGEIGKSTGTQLTYPLFFFEPDPDRRCRIFSCLLVSRSPSHRLIILLLFWWGCRCLRRGSFAFGSHRWPSGSFGLIVVPPHSLLEVLFKEFVNYSHVPQVTCFGIIRIRSSNSYPRS